jgi:hypothetical protein
MVHLWDLYDYTILTAMYSIYNFIMALLYLYFLLLFDSSHTKSQTAKVRWR